jgi:acyl-CoA synthetase (NDP forming)
MRSQVTTAISEILQAAWGEGRRLLLDHEAFRLCEAAGLPIPTWCYVRSGETLPDLSVFTGEEIVVKGVAPGLLHKTESGAVCFVRACAEDVEEARNDMARRIGPGFQGVLLVERVWYRGDFGLEMLLSARFDDAFGPVIAFGVGGIHTEFYHSVLAPGLSLAVRAAEGLDRDGVRAMLAQTVSAAALRGELRGQDGGAVDTGALENLILAVADTALALSPLGREAGVYLRELEFNPVVVSSDNGAVLLDVLVGLMDGRPISPARPLDKVGRLLKPRSALVVGASANAVNPGHIILNNLQRGGGVPADRIWCLHPKAEQIDGSRCFKTTSDVPEQVDMAIVTIPAGAGADQMVADMVLHRKAHAVTLISGGFGETRAGRERESELREVIQRSHLESDGGVVVNGGNCLGIVSRPGGYNTFFLPPYKLRFTGSGTGNLASISQSGAYLVTQASNLESVVSPRYSISFGNQIDLTVSDYLAYLKNDDDVRVFCAYVEGFQPGDGIRFATEARDIIAGGRAVLLYKAGRSEEGSRAARSHTAAMAGDYEVTKEILGNAGVVVTESLDELEDLVKVFCLLEGRRAQGLRVGVVSNAGFEATAAADNLCGLTLAEFRPETKQALAVLLPQGIIDVHNPVDATPVTDSETFAAIVQVLVDDPAIDLVVASPVAPTPFLENLPAGPGHGEDITQPTSVPSRLISLFHNTAKPMVVCVDSGPLYTPGVDMMQRAGVPCFRRIDRAMRALTTYARFSRDRQ